MKPRLSVILALLAVSVAVRLIPYVLAQFGMTVEPGNTVYPWNFSPFLPICLFGGAMFARARMAYLVPFAAWLLGDLGVWALTGRADWAFYAHQPVIYLSVALVAFIGFSLRRGRSWKGVRRRRDLSAQLRRPRRVLRDGDSVPAEHAGQHGGLPAAPVQPRRPDQADRRPRVPPGIQPYLRVAR